MNRMLVSKFNQESKRSEHQKLQNIDERNFRRQK